MQKKRVGKSNYFYTTIREKDKVRRIYLGKDYKKALLKESRLKNNSFDIKPLFNIILIFIFICSTIFFINYLPSKFSITGFSVWSNLTNADFDLGTYSQTGYNATISAIQINVSLFKAGNYTSTIFDCGSTVGCSWINLTWSEGAPYQEELVSNGFDELKNNYMNGTNMTGNVLLMHFNNDSNFGENRTYVYDFSGMGNNGSCSATTCPNLTNGKFNNGLVFDAKNDFIGIPISPSLNSTRITNQSTLSAWIKINKYPATIASVIVEKVSGTSIDYTMIITTTGELRTYFSASCDSSINMNINTWYYIASVFNGSQVLLYINGINVNSADCIQSPNGNGENITISIGKRMDNTRYFNGTIDEVAVWNRTLTPNEVLDIYKRGALRLNLSVRSCDDSACSGESWSAGYENASYNSMSISNNRYFQYRANMETNSTWLSPEFYNISVGYTPLNLSLTECQDINISGATYTLLNNVNSSATCFNITVPNVDMYGDGYTVNYSNAGTTGYGFITNATNVNIRNFKIVEGKTIGNYKYSILSSKGNNSLIYNNTITTRGSGGYGIYLLNNVHGTNLSYNNITITGVNTYGIYFLTNQNDNFIYNNNITTNQNGAYGIYLNAVTNNTLKNNKVYTSLSMSYFITGTTLSDFNNSIDTNNLAEGLPVNYTYNKENLTFTGYSDYGQVIFAYCRNITIENSNFSNDTLTFLYTNNSVISNNIIEGNTCYAGIYLDANSKYVNISKNNVTAVTTRCSGINLYSSNNNVEYNNITTLGNDAYGLGLSSSTNNYFNYNKILTKGSSSYGIYLVTSSNNNIFNNTIVNTTDIITYGILFGNLNNNSFYNSFIVSYASALRTNAKANATFKDARLNYTTEWGFYNLRSIAIANITLINMTMLNGSRISMNFSGNGTLYNYYYITTQVNDTNGVLANAEVDVYNKNKVLVSSVLTDTNGIAKLEYLEYNLTNGTFPNNIYSYWSNYTVNVSKAGYLNYTNATINLSDTMNTFVFVLLNSQPPTIIDYNVTDVSGGIINSSNPASGYENLSITVSASSGVGVSSVFVTIWKTVVDGTDKLWEGFLTLIQGTVLNGVWWGSFFTNTSYSGMINYTISINDTTNNTVSVNANFTIDATYPLIFIEYPINNTNTTNTLLNINYTVSDLNLASCWYSNDSYSSNTTLNNCINITTVSWYEGLHNLTVWANDSAGNTNSSSVTFMIDTTAPTIDYNITHSDNTFVNNTNPAGVNENISITVGASDSGAGISSVFVRIWNGVVDASTVIWEGFLNLLSGNIWEGIWGTSFMTNTSYSGMVNYTISINDTTNNTASVNANFTVDAIAPDINIVSPNNNTNSSNTNLDVNYTFSDNLIIGSCWYSNDTMNINNSLTNCVNITNLIWYEGQHNVTIWANDSVNNINATSVRFTIDSVAPIINLIYPNNNTGNNYGNLTFEYNVTDANNIINCSLMLNNILNQTNEVITKNIPLNFNLTNLGNNSYNWAVKCVDIANNINTTNRTFAVALTKEFNGRTTNLTNVEDISNTNLAIENLEYGLINFSEAVNLSRGMNIDKDTNISFNRIELNLNKNMRLSFYNLTFSNPQPLKDGAVCSTCTEISYIDGNYVYDANGAGLYSAQETPVIVTAAPAAGGGGGGGGSMGGQQVIPLKLTPEIFKTKMVTVAIDKKNMKLQNDGDVPLKIDLSIKGLENIVELEEKTIEIPPYSFKEIPLIIKAPEKAGVYNGELIADSKKGKVSSIILIEVESENPAFEVTLDIPDDYKEIYSEDELAFKIDIQNKGIISEGNTQLTYLIKDSLGNEIYREEANQSIKDKLSLVKKIKTPKLKQGTYVSIVELRYKDTTAVSSSTFKIKGKEAIIKENMNLNLILATSIIILIITLIAYSGIKKFKLKLKKKDLNKLKEGYKKGSLSKDAYEKLFKKK